jgi:predicted 2-oxoglutarate/Fe(II)-dependent dioxygenase YbiX
MYDFYYLDNFYNKKEIYLILKLINQNKYLEKDTPAEHSEKICKVTHCQWQYLNNPLNKFKNFCYEINKFYFGYDLFPTLDTDRIALTTYESKENGKYSWHRDGSGSSIYDIKLTAIINVSDTKYTGGNFELFLNGIYKEIEFLKNPGSIIIFKSHISHRVTEVLTGTRKSLTFWLSGPSFK